jgi:hypothetical protein
MAKDGEITVILQDRSSGRSPYDQHALRSPCSSATCTMISTTISASSARSSTERPHHQRLAPTRCVKASGIGYELVTTKARKPLRYAIAVTEDTRFAT